MLLFGPFASHSLVDDLRSDGHQSLSPKAYQAARRSALYDLGCYMMANADEYWAEGVQAWYGRHMEVLLCLLTSWGCAFLTGASGEEPTRWDAPLQTPLDFLACHPCCPHRFHATERTDVNSGIKSRELLRSHDPKLAAIIERTFGAANKWRYCDECPGRLKPHGAPAEGKGQQPWITHRAADACDVARRRVWGGGGNSPPVPGPNPHNR